jgi:uncharacterized protein YmfQ (DUF2313 family)
MPAPTFSPTDYLWQFQRLLPRGRVWHRGWGTVQAADILTLMPTWARLSARANDLIADVFPCTTTDLLPEWEASLGLPDPCTGPLDSIQERVAAVCATFTARGGQSVAYFIAVCETLGFEGVTIDEFPATSDIEAPPVFTWRVNIHTSTQTVWFRAGVSTAGDPLASWGSNVLECTLELLKPAHTNIIFAYHDDDATTSDAAASA